MKRIAFDLLAGLIIALIIPGLFLAGLETSGTDVPTMAYVIFVGGGFLGGAYAYDKLPDD
jgi:hypothetical protein